MSIREEFDEWALAGRDRGMEERHWHTAKHALERIPIEPDDVVLDLGTGSGYAVRAIRQASNAGHCYGLDGSPRMAENAYRYSKDPDIGFLVADFGALPFSAKSVDHVFSMEAFYYATNPLETIEEIHRILREGGTFTCAVNFFRESVHTHRWQERIDVPMTLWAMADYRDAFESAGLTVTEQETIPDDEIEIPPAEDFPIDEWETREAMVDRYRRWGTLLTIGVKS